MLNRNVTVSALAMASALALSACGGGGDAAPAADPSGGNVAVTSLAIGGTAATGAAIAAGTVEAKCANGTATASTASDGIYTLEVSGGVLPCVLRVTNGNVVLHSLVASPSIDGASTIVANITPLTELLVANVAGGAPAALFASFDATAQARVTEAAVDQAIAVTLTALTGSVDLTGIDPIHDVLVAANGGSVGNALDRALDQLQAALAASQTTLAGLSTAVAAGTTAAAPVLPQIAARASSCAALRSGTYRVINPHETANDHDYAAYRLTLDATALTVTDAEPGHTPESAALTAVAGAPCSFTYEGEFGTETALVSPAGVIVVRSPSSTGPIRTSLLVPEQVIPLAQLAGTWNYVAYVDGENHGVLQPSNGVRVIDAAGKVVSGTECVGLICSPAESVISDLTVDAAGGFDIAGEGGAVARVFAFKTGEGAMSLYVLDPNEGGLTVLTKQVALVLPSVGKTSQNWDFTVGSGSFRWAPANNPQGGASALSDQSIAVTEVDVAAQSFSRVRAADQRTDSVTINSPRDGMRTRPAGANVSATVMMPVTGTGLVFYTSTAANQNFFGISIDHP